MNVFKTLGESFGAVPTIDEWEWETDGEDIKLSYLIGDDWKDEVIKWKDLEPWLEDHEYLSGNYDIATHDGLTDTVYFSWSYYEFIHEHMTKEILSDYLNEKHQFNFA